MKTVFLLSQIATIAAFSFLAAPYVLPACEFEDSSNCVWNADQRGNGLGQSFMDILGVVFVIG